MGLRSIRTKFFQYVTIRNRLELLVFAKTYLKFKENFDQAIFVDESTIRMCRTGSRTWFKVLPHENSFDLVGKYKSAIKVNVIGGISRNGSTYLLVFEGKMDGPGFETMVTGFLLQFIAEKMPNFHILYMDNAP